MIELFLIERVGDTFVGKLDDISLWNVALDETTIRRYAFERMAGNEKGLLGYWSFNEGSGSTVHDWSYHGNYPLFLIISPFKTETRTRTVQL